MHKNAYQVSQITNYINNECLLDLLELKQVQPSSSFALEKDKIKKQSNIKNFKSNYEHAIELLFEKAKNQGLGWIENGDVTYYVKKKFDIISSPLMIRNNEWTNASIHLLVRTPAFNVLFGHKENEQKCEYNLICYSKLDDVKACKHLIIAEMLQPVLNGVPDVYFFKLDSNKNECPLQKVNVFEPKYVNLVKGARDWLDSLYQNKSFDINTSKDPFHALLYPNLSPNYNSITGYEDIKNKLAEQWRDVSQLYYIGKKTKGELHSKGIYTYDNPAFREHLHNSTLEVRDVQLKMLDWLLFPLSYTHKVNITENLFTEQLIYLDTESYQNSNFEWKNVMIGCVTDRNYFVFTHEIEDECIRDFQKTFDTSATYVHYTDADIIVFKNLPSYRNLDLHKIIKERYLSDVRLQALRLTCFSLKHIVKKFCAFFGLVDPYFKLKVKNGLEAAHIIADTIEKKKSLIMLDRVILYNKVDCAVMFMLYHWLEFNSVPSDCNWMWSEDL